MVNKRRACRGISSQKVDLDEYNFLNGQGTSQGFHEFTDQPYIFKANGLAEKYGISDFEHKVLFSRPWTGPQSPWENGGMSTVELELMKSSMMKYNSPILFVWKHPQRSYWHANLCFGYDDNKVTDWGKGVLICRDSALGELDTEGRRNYYEMPYQMALESGKHATVYYLPEDDPDQKVSRADGAPDCGPEPKKTELASMSKPSHTQSFGDRSSGPFGDSLFKSKRF